MSTIGKIFGSDTIIKEGLENIDKAFYTDQEKADDAVLMIGAKNDAKIKLLEAYAPFKLAQRYIAFMFTFVFVFIMLNGVIGALYGVVDMNNVDDALQFANKMWLGEIMLTIVGFYFSGGVIESINNGKKK